MNAVFDEPRPQQFNVFRVTQIAPDTFLDGVLGVDFIVIPAHSTSEVHRHNNSDNLIFVLHGSARIILNGLERSISRGMRVYIPRGMYHGFSTSADELEFVSLQLPAILDKKRNILDLEVQTPSV